MQDEPNELHSPESHYLRLLDERNLKDSNNPDETRVRLAVFDSSLAICERLERIMEQLHRLEQARLP